MIRDITIPAKECSCSACGYTWISISTRIPESCRNRDCRSREWNGKKIKRKPERGPKVKLPKPVRVRGGNDDEF